MNNPTIPTDTDEDSSDVYPSGAFVKCSPANRHIVVQQVYFPTLVRADVDQVVDGPDEEGYYRVLFDGKVWFARSEDLEKL